MVTAVLARFAPFWKRIGTFTPKVMQAAPQLALMVRVLPTPLNATSAPPTLKLPAEMKASVLAINVLAFARETRLPAWLKLPPARLTSAPVVLIVPASSRAKSSAGLLDR